MDNNEMLERGIKELQKYHPKDSMAITADDMWGILQAMKEKPKVKVHMGLNPCCSAGIEVKLGKEGEWCTKCGKRIDEPEEKYGRSRLVDALPAFKKRNEIIRKALKRGWKGKKEQDSPSKCNKTVRDTVIDFIDNVLMSEAKFIMELEESEYGQVYTRDEVITIEHKHGLTKISREKRVM